MKLGTALSVWLGPDGMLSPFQTCSPDLQIWCQFNMSVSWLNKHPGHFYVKVTTAILLAWICNISVSSAQHKFELNSVRLTYRERNVRFILSSNVTNKFNMTPLFHHQDATRPLLLCPRLDNQLESTCQHCGVGLMQCDTLMFLKWEPSPVCPSLGIISYSHATLRMCAVILNMAHSFFVPFPRCGRLLGFFISKLILPLVVSARRFQFNLTTDMGLLGLSVSPSGGSVHSSASFYTRVSKEYGIPYI